MVVSVDTAEHTIGPRGGPISFQFEFREMSAEISPHSQKLFIAGVFVIISNIWRNSWIFPTRGDGSVRYTMTNGIQVKKSAFVFYTNILILVFVEALDISNDCL